MTPVPIALEDAPTWYESADTGSERLTWGQYKGEVDDTYQITPFDVDDDGDVDLVVGSRDQTTKVYFNDSTQASLSPAPSSASRTTPGPWPGHHNETALTRRASDATTRSTSTATATPTWSPARRSASALASLSHPNPI